MYIRAMSTMPPVAEMQRAYLESDPSFTGLFFLGVRTTGIFCRPTCPARKPLPANVEYFPTADAALVAGYRPCKRCRPLEVDEQPRWVTDLLAKVDRDPSARMGDAVLRGAGMDPATVRRYFRAHFGMTFQGYLRMRRLGGAFGLIREGESIDSAVFESGYESHSGFREAFLRVFGDPPGASRDGDCVLLSWVRSPLGPLIAGATAEGVCLLEFTDRRMLEAQFATVRRLFAMPAVPGTNRHLENLADELARYFDGTLRRFSVPLVYPGSAFQRRVWGELLRIPYGQTRSYEQVAAALGAPKAVRAVGHANGLNRIAVLIPCHRVVNKDGKLGGYGGGPWRKRRLLEREGAAIPEA
jgi:AraC family transcriptional regulator, regulatory protein of adaptative response / methylated-DNA-[protein]-cysteine methyltransferase